MGQLPTSRVYGPTFLAVVFGLFAESLVMSSQLFHVLDVHKSSLSCSDHYLMHLIQIMTHRIISNLR
ncbi:hypothetical protein DNF23_58140 [Pseudomonas syringae pv. pisi]